jgi:hypothetical protein
MSRDFSSELAALRLRQASETLADAKSLLDANRTPRSAINRTYYAMFYAVLALLQTVGRVASKHTGVISLFDSEFVRTGIFPKEMSQTLHEAFDQRLESDYEPVKSQSREEALELLDRAQQFVSRVTDYIGRAHTQ